jgi:hypothetical protein
VDNPKDKHRGAPPSVDEQDLRDIHAEEAGRGRKHPKSALTLKRERTLRKIARALADPNCDEETYLAASRELGLTDESRELREILALWKKRRGNG